MFFQLSSLTAIRGISNMGTKKQHPIASKHEHNTTSKLFKAIRNYLNQIHRNKAEELITYSEAGLISAPVSGERFY